MFSLIKNKNKKSKKTEKNTQKSSFSVQIYSPTFNSAFLLCSQLGVSFAPYHLMESPQFTVHIWTASLELPCLVRYIASYFLT